MTKLPERIWAHVDSATVYMDGSSPVVGSTRERPKMVEYVRADRIEGHAAAPFGYVSEHALDVFKRRAWDFATVAAKKHGVFAVPLYAHPPAQVAPEGATHRHKKRGSEYVLLGYGKMQVEGWYEGLGHEDHTASVDMREVAIYRSVDDGSLWVRPREEFEDGRFEALTAQTPPEGAVTQPDVDYEVWQNGCMMASSNPRATKALREAADELHENFKHPTKGIEALRKLTKLRQEKPIASNVAALVDELADAVDAAWKDIGGCRSHREILNDIRAALMTTAHPPAQVGAVTEAQIEALQSMRCAPIDDADAWTEGHIEGWNDAIEAAVAALGAQTPPEGAVTVVQGWRLVPDKASRRWAETMANRRQGQSSTPRCEPPGEYEIEWAFNRINEVLAAAPTPPVNQSEGADRG